MKKLLSGLSILVLGLVLVLTGCGHKHTFDHISAKSATCTQSGNIEYWHCTECDEYYMDANGNERIDPNEVYVNPSHKTTYVSKEEATCTEDGYESHYKCTACNKTFSDSEGNNPIDLKDITIESKGGHRMEFRDGQDATCDSEGIVAHYYCVECYNAYEDQQGKIKLETITIPQLKHELTKVAAKEATCTEDGNYEHYHCSLCNRDFQDASGNNETYPKISSTGHSLSYVNPVYATCTEDGTIGYYHCSVCDKKYFDYGEKEITSDEELVAPARGHNATHHEAVPATCYQQGTVEYYYCYSCYKYFEEEECITEIDSIETPQLEHNFKETYSSDDEYHWYECTLCEEKREKTLHTFNDEGICEVCNHKFLGTVGLKFYQSYHWVGGKYVYYYVVSDYEGTKQDVVIPATFNGLPVEEIASSAFANNNTIVTVSIPGSVVEINSYAFEDCKNLVSVSAPGVMYISAGAFNNCEKLEYYNYNSTNNTNVIHATLGSSAFKNCKALTSVEVNSDNNSRIESSAFEGCTNLANVKLLNVKYLESYAFAYTAIETIDLTFVTEINQGAFKGCTNLKSAKISANITTLGSSAFEGCTSLTSIDLSLSVHLEAFGQKVFKDCTSLISAKLPISLTEISAEAFANTALQTFEVPSNVKTIADLAFDNCISLVEVRNHSKISIRAGSNINGGIAEHALSVVNGTAESNIFTIGTFKFVKYGTEDAALFSYVGNATDLQLPLIEDLAEYGVTRYFINANTFAANTTLETINVPNIVYLIKENGFSGTSAEIVFAEDAQIILEDYAFENYQGETFNFVPGITFKTATTPIPFSDTAIVTASGSVDQLEVLAYCSNVQNLTFTSGTIIKSSSFAQEGLRSVIINAPIETIEWRAFENNDNLTTVILNPELKTIESEAFKGAKFESITLPDGLEVIEGSAFSNNKALKSIVIPESVIEMGASTFKGCTSLESITIPFLGKSQDETLNTHFSYIFGGAIYEGSILETPDSDVPKSLKEVKITNDSSIEKGAFSIRGNALTNIETIYLPANLQTVGEDAFKGCTGIKNIYYANTLEEYLKITFINDYSNPAYYGRLENFYLLDDDSSYYRIEKVEIPTGVVEVKDYAFNGIAQIKEVIIPNTVTSLGTKAFKEANGLNYVYIPSSVIDIGQDCFDLYPSYVKIFCEDTAKKEGWLDTIFNGNSRGVYFGVNIDNFLIDSNGLVYKAYTVEEVTYATVAAYIGTSKDVTIPETVTINEQELPVTKVLSYAFSNSVAENVILSASLDELRSYSFYNSNIANITFSTDPASSLFIRERSFYGCSNIKYLYVPLTVKMIESYAFENIGSALIYVEAETPYSSSWCDDNAFGSSLYHGVTSANSTIQNNIAYYLKGNEATVTKYFGSEEEVVIPSTITYNDVTYNVVEIGPRAFYLCENITKVSIGEGVKLINEQAFYDCTSLKEIELPSSLEYIEGSYALWTNSLYPAIPVSNELVYNVYKGGKYLGNETNPYTVFMGLDETFDETFEFHPDTKILYHTVGNEYSGYYENKLITTLKTISIPAGVTQIGPGVFANFSSDITPILEEVIIPNNSKLRVIGDRAFDGVTSLSKISFPASLKEIGGKAFYNCGLVNVQLNEGLDYIQELAFAYNTNLKEFHMSSTITRCDRGTYQPYEGILRGCNALEKVTINLEVADVGFLFAPGEVSNNYHIPTTLKEITTIGGNNIGNYVFKGCISVEKITIGEGPTQITANAFASCTLLTSLSIPSSIETIESGAFTPLEALEYKTYENGLYLGNETDPYLVLVDVVDETVTEFVIHPDAKIVLEGAFAGCSGIKELVLHENLTNVAEGALSGLSGLEKLTLDQQVAGSYIGLLFGTGSYTGSTNIYTGLNQSTYFYLPKYFKEVVLTGEGNISITTFHYLQTIQNLTISEGITYDYNYNNQTLLYNCINLRSLALPGSAIKYYPFGSLFAKYQYSGYDTGTSNTITAVEVEQKVNEDNNVYGYISYYVPPYLSKVEIYGDIEDKEYLFYNMETLKEVIFDETVTELSNDMFYNCTNLEKITAPGVTKISATALVNVEQLTSLTTYENGKYFGTKDNPYYAFMGVVDTTVAELVIHDDTKVVNGLTNITECSNLTKVTLPGKLEAIGDSGFYIFDYASEEKLSDIYFKGTIEDWCKIKFECTGDRANTSYSNPMMQAEHLYVYQNGTTTFEEVTELVIPETVTRIEALQFAGMDNLTSVTLHENIEYIDVTAFSNCANLPYVVIPKEVEQIWYTQISQIDIPVFYYEVGVKKDGWYLPMDYESNIYSYFYSEEEPIDTEGYYWHYVDNVPTIWVI